MLVNSPFVKKRHLKSPVKTNSNRKVLLLLLLLRSAILNDYMGKKMSKLQQNAAARAFIAIFSCGSHFSLFGFFCTVVRNFSFLIEFIKF